MEPHFGHTELIVVVLVSAGIYVWTLVNGKQSPLRLSEREDLLHRVELTFAGSSTLRPHVNNVFVVGRSAVLIPSTAGSATADSAGFHKRTAL